jgi:hypothetical protein
MKITKDPKIDVDIIKTFTLDNGLRVEIGTFPNRRIIVEGIVVGRLSPTNDNPFGPEYPEGNPETEARNTYGGEEGLIAFAGRLNKLLLDLQQRIKDDMTDQELLLKVFSDLMEKVKNSIVSKI